jgi:hypothetical protein
MAAVSSTKKKPSKRLFVLLGVGLALIVMNFALPRLLFGGDGDEPFVPARTQTSSTTVPADAGDGSEPPTVPGGATRDPFQPPA